VELITLADVTTSRKLFEEYEPYDFFYCTMHFLLDPEIERLKNADISNHDIKDFVSHLMFALMFWNSRFYVPKGKRLDRPQHFRDVEALLKKHWLKLMSFRDRTIESYSDKDESLVAELFRDFRPVLGGVGSAKCLYIMAPRFFPLWDSRIGDAYRCRKRDSTDYLKFISIAKDQVKALGGESAIGRNPLKAIDEVNFCRYVLGLNVRGDRAKFEAALAKVADVPPDDEDRL
jgi:hypothetical protein